MNRLHIDLSVLTPLTTDHALEFMHKALADPPDSDALWDQHPDPLLRDVVELLYLRVNEQMRRALRELAHIVRDMDRLGKAFPASMADVQRAVAKLNGKQPTDYSVDDWMTLIDWLMLKHLPDAFVRSEAERMAVRATIAGRIKGADPGVAPGPNYDAVLPNTIAAAVAELALPSFQQQLLNLAAARAGEAITVIGESTRHRVKQLVVNHLQARLTGDRGATAKRLERQLFDEFSILNRDWRRVAITETGSIANEALIASQPIGALVRRFEAYKGACPFCQKIHGMVFTVVAASKPDKDGWKEVWPGKTNYGRSAAPRKRVGEELIERMPAERWWPPAGLVHPNCRGGYTPLTDTAARDPKTVDFVEQLLKKHGLVKVPA